MEKNNSKAHVHSYIHSLPDSMHSLGFHTQQLEKQKPIARQQEWDQIQIYVTWLHDINWLQNEKLHWPYC